MRKRLITTTLQNAPDLDKDWLDLDSAATVEVTSEAKEYPVEAALVSGETPYGVPPILVPKPSG